jgi:tRNA nucleotidyltransferase/poly(A) polymerase
VSIDNLFKAISEEPVIKEISRCTFAGKVFLVGGAIREIFLNKNPKDYDFALTQRQDLRVFENTFGARSFLLGKKPIQTYRIVSRDISLDMSVLDGPIEDDLARRDFTMNALAFDVTEHKLIDSLKGIDDIKTRIVRCVSNQNLLDDPLRMLKALRHFATLDGFVVDEKLLDAIQALKHHINEVAPERIRHELDQIVVSDRSFDGLRILQETGLLFVLFPELHALKRLDEEKNFVLETFGHTIDGFKYLPTYGKEYLLDERSYRNVAYALLFHDIGKAHTFSYDNVKKVVHFFYHEKFSCNLAILAMEKLRFSSLDIKTVVKLIESHMRIFLISNSQSSDKAIRRLVYKVGDLTPALIVLTLCDMYGSSGGTENDSTIMVQKRCGDVLQALNEWRQKPLPRLVTGHDLLALGFEQGPRIGKVLDDIRERQIGGELVKREDALRFASDQLGNNAR